MANWTPTQEGVGQILQILKESQNPDPRIQQQINEFISNYSQVPDFPRYLVYIFSNLRNETEYVRSCAGFLLKNNLKDNYKKMPKEVQDYVKNEALKCIGDPSASVRRATGTIITTILQHGGPKAWPDLLNILNQFLDSSDLSLVEGSLNTLMVICEDHAHRLDSNELGRPLNFLIPKFLTFFKSPHIQFRIYAISSLKQFVTEMPGALIANMDNFLQGIFYLANDPSPDVKKRVCQVFCMLAEIRIDYLIPHMKNIIEFLLAATMDKDDNVALEACEFWNSILETKVAAQILAEFLPKLVPTLLERMIYSDSDLAHFGPEIDDNVADKPEDIKPFIQKSKSRGVSGGSTLDDQEEDDEDDEDDDDTEVSEWTIRKCSAAALDSLSLTFKHQLLPILLPEIQKRLNSPDWRVKESAVLALGAIAPGTMSGLKQYLPQLVPFLYSMLSDPKSLLRSITCWTLSRFSEWASMQNPEEYLKPMMTNLLNRMLDHNKKVQEAACSAFATLEEHAQTELVPYLEPILKYLMTAYEKYQARNLYILYDCIGTLADAVRGELNKPEYINILMPPLTARWNSLSDDDPDLLPLLECMTSVASALGLGFQNFALVVYQRCLKLIQNTLIQQQMAEQGQADNPEIDFLIISLDLISGLCEGLQVSVESLIANSNLPQLLLGCMKAQGYDVQQSTFALIGDLSRTCIVHIQPYLHEYIPILTDNLMSNNVAVCNNASWAIGEIAVKVGDKLTPFVPTILNKLCQLINRPSLNPSLLQNTAITIGRLGLVCPDVLATRIEDFIEPWCYILRNVQDQTEKESACRGLIKMIKINPSGIIKNFIGVCDVIISFEVPPPADLRDQFYEILVGFKNSMQPQQWNRYIDSFPDHIRQALRQMYNI